MFPFSQNCKQTQTFIDDVTRWYYVTECLVARNSSITKPLTTTNQSLFPIIFAAAVAVVDFGVVDALAVAVVVVAVSAVIAVAVVAVAVVLMLLLFFDHHR